MVVALAGRRIDGPCTRPARFPLENVPLVEKRIRDLLAAQRAAVLVSSAACGADLLAQRAAAALGLRRRIILPFEPARFRETSVADRPGGWGPLFDDVIAEVAAADDLVVLEGAGDGDHAYGEATRVILAEALSLAARDDGVACSDRRPRAAAGADVLAVVVWDRRLRDQDDLTGLFAREAAALGLPLVELSTLD